MPLREYEVTIQGQTHTLQLSEDDAKRYLGAKPVSKPEGKGVTPANKQQTPTNK